MKTILTGNEAIEAYEDLQGTHPTGHHPKKCGYFTSDDCDLTKHYDKNTIVAFDATGEFFYEDAFSTVNDAINWID
jgi:hypothetical protein